MIVLLICTTSSVVIVPVLLLIKPAVTTTSSRPTLLAPSTPISPVTSSVPLVMLSTESPDTVKTFAEIATGAELALLTAVIVDVPSVINVPCTTRLLSSARFRKLPAEFVKSRTVKSKPPALTLSVPKNISISVVVAVMSAMTFTSLLKKSTSNVPGANALMSVAAAIPAPEDMTHIASTVAAVVERNAPRRVDVRNEPALNALVSNGMFVISECPL